jgi:tRNA dimethylallyltransferase
VVPQALELHDEQGRPRVVVICGPTAAGKTSLSLEVAARFGGEILNADSTQVYRGMDVGTDKVPVAQRAGIPHSLMDLVDPDESFTAAHYVELGRQKVLELTEAGRLPVVVGGTGFYIQALLEGLFPQADIPDEIRSDLAARAEGPEGLAILYARLREVDPESAQRVAPADRFRILRALEVYEATGRTITAHWAEHAQAREEYKSQTLPSDPTGRAARAAGHPWAPADYQVLHLGIAPPRELLYERINQRAVAQMTHGHLEAEVRGLLERYPPDLAAFQALTYRHMIHVLHGTWTPQHALATLQRDTRNYAKRQLTWFRGHGEVTWIEAQAALAAVAAFLGATG